ncbi:MAG: XrtA system polysaccharide chain length determinant [Cellvibrionaceae bacterium]
MTLSIFEILKFLRREVWEKRRLFALLYFVTSMAFLFIGWYWPKVYSSESAIYVDDQNILRPLMEGTAVTTDVSDRAKLAREIIFSKDFMDQILETFEWFEDADRGEVAKERLVSEIQSRTQINNAGKNLIKISYVDKDPMHAFKITDFITHEFINRSTKTRQQESRNAYNFINQQVEEYHGKLIAAEEALKNFRSSNLDASPGAQRSVDDRIVELRRRIEATQLEIREAKIRKNTLNKQLTGELSVSASRSREGQYNTRLQELQSQLEELRLSYHDTYPDIVSIKGQMAEIEKARLRERQARERGEDLGDGYASAPEKNALYEELRSEVSSTESRIAMLDARLLENHDLLKKEEDRIIRINDMDANLSELTRDYQVNQDIYNSLVRQRERAYISMNIDEEEQGETFKEQEPASLQLTPRGIRFAHFVAGGLLFSFLVPLGAILGLAFLDGKVRMESEVSEKMGLPVLASVYHMNTPTEYSLNTLKKSFVTFLVIGSWILYGYAIWVRLQGVV